MISHLGFRVHTPEFCEDFIFFAEGLDEVLCNEV